MKPRYNEGPRDYQNLFAIPRFRYIDVLSLLLGKLKNSAFKFVPYIQRTSLHGGSLCRGSTVDGNLKL